MSNPGFPIMPTISSPSKSENPMMMNTTVPIQKSIRFFMMMFPAFLALVNPVSTIAKPACIQNTNAAPIRNHTAKIAELSIIIPPSSSHRRSICILPGAMDQGFSAIQKNKTCHIPGWNSDTSLCIALFKFRLSI